GNMAARHLTRYEGAVQFHAKPFAKLAVIRQRTPDPRNRCLEFDALLDTVVHVKQPPGCILLCAAQKRNQIVALSTGLGCGGTGVSPVRCGGSPAHATAAQPSGSRSRR